MKAGALPLSLIPSLFATSDDGGLTMAAAAKRIEIGDEERAQLERIVRAATSEARMVERARIVLGAGGGWSGAPIARRGGGTPAHPRAEVARSLRARRAYRAARSAQAGQAARARPGDQGAADRQGVH